MSVGVAMPIVMDIPCMMVLRVVLTEDPYTPVQ
jgi:hypothetical protein